MTPSERLEANAARAMHKAKLEEKYGVKGNSKSDALFNLAWEFGHSAGFSEVEIYYADLVELVKP